MTRTALSPMQVRRGVLLGRTIAQQRQRVGLTQVDLAQKAGVSLQALLKVEQGHVANPGVFSVAALAQVLEVPLSVLVEAVRAGSGAGLSTLGYEGLDADAFIARLEDMHADTVIDVRLNPLSRKPGLSKTRLGDALMARGIDYRHVRSLGNPKQNRAAFAGDDLLLGRERFRALLSHPEALQALCEIAHVVREKHVVLICFEKDEGRCHRAVVAEELAQLG